MLLKARPGAACHGCCWRSHTHCCCPPHCCYLPHCWTILLLQTACCCWRRKGLCWCWSCQRPCRLPSCCCLLLRWVCVQCAPRASHTCDLQAAEEAEGTRVSCILCMDIKCTTLSHVTRMSRLLAARVQAVTPPTTTTPHNLHSKPPRPSPHLRACSRPLPSACCRAPRVRAPLRC